MKLCTAQSKVRDDDGHVVRGDDGKPLLRPCQALALAGMNVCRMHGGSSPQAKAGAAKRIAEASLRRDAARQHRARAPEKGSNDPFEAMLDELARANAEIDRIDEELRSATPSQRIDLVQLQREARRDRINAAKVVGTVNAQDLALRLAHDQIEELARILRVAIERIIVDLFRRPRFEVRAEYADYVNAVVAYALHLSEDPDAKPPAVPKFPKPSQRLARELERPAEQQQRAHERGFVSTRASSRPTPVPPVQRPELEVVHEPPKTRPRASRTARDADRRRREAIQRQEATAHGNG